MSTIATAISRPSDLSRGLDPAIDVAATTEVPTSLAQFSCWRLLTARVPLTLLLDLAVDEDHLEDLHDAMLGETSPIDWIPQQRH